jgi:hypothetical protein
MTTELQASVSYVVRNPKTLEFKRSVPIGPCPIVLTDEKEWRLPDGLVVVERDPVYGPTGPMRVRELAFEWSYGDHDYSITRTFVKPVFLGKHENITFLAKQGMKLADEFVKGASDGMDDTENVGGT